MGFEIIMAAVKHNNSEGVSQKIKNYGLFFFFFWFGKGTNERNESIAKERITQPNWTRKCEKHSNPPDYVMHHTFTFLYSL